jgi:hypothetical protein
LLRAAGQGSTQVRYSGSVRQAEWLAQSSRRPDIEAVLAPRNIAGRAQSPSTSRTGRCPTGTSANWPEPMDCNAARGFSHKGTEEIASACTEAQEADRCDEKPQDPLARQDHQCGLDLVDGGPILCVPAVAAPLAGWPLPWIAWTFYPSFQHPLHTPRVRVWRKRFFYPSMDEPADESSGDGRERV